MFCFKTLNLKQMRHIQNLLTLQYRPVHHWWSWNQCKLVGRCTGRGSHWSTRCSSWQLCNPWSHWRDRVRWRVRTCWLHPDPPAAKSVKSDVEQGFRTAEVIDYRRSDSESTCPIPDKAPRADGIRPGLEGFTVIPLQQNVPKKVVEMEDDIAARIEKAISANSQVLSNSNALSTYQNPNIAKSVKTWTKQKTRYKDRMRYMNLSWSAPFDSVFFKKRVRSYAGIHSVFNIQIDNKPYSNH